MQRSKDMTPQPQTAGSNQIHGSAAVITVNESPVPTETRLDGLQRLHDER
jgi:hypothetical protein